jgi:predicted nucleic acid-binding Zn ribbon protein
MSTQANPYCPTCGAPISQEEGYRPDLRYEVGGRFFCSPKCWSDMMNKPQPEEKKET